MSHAGEKRAAAADDSSPPAKCARTDADGSDTVAASAAASSAAAASADERHHRLLLSRPSVAQLAPQDTLSHMLAFLASQEFAAAARACRQWRAALVRGTSWPAFSLPSLRISTRSPGVPLMGGGRPVMIKLGFSDPVGKAPKRFVWRPDGPLASLLQQPAAAVLQALDLRSRYVPAAAAELIQLGRHTLQQLSQFSRLQAVRLPALPFTAADLALHLPRISGLTALFVGDVPQRRNAAVFPLSVLRPLAPKLRALSVPSEVDDVSVLDAMTPLEFLRINVSDSHQHSVLQGLLNSARILSVSSSLRVLELHGPEVRVDVSGLCAQTAVRPRRRAQPRRNVYNEHDGSWTAVEAEDSEDEASYEAAMTVARSSPHMRPAHLRAAALHSIYADTVHLGEGGFHQLLTLPFLKTLRVCARGGLEWLALEVSKRPMPAEPSPVTDLRLTETHGVFVSQADPDTMATMVSRLANLQRLHIHPGLKQPGRLEAAAGFWSHCITHLYALRELHTSWHGSGLSAVALRALSSLSHFHTLHMRYTGDARTHSLVRLMEDDQRLSMEPSIRLRLHAISQSSTWRTLVLRGVYVDTSPLEQFVDTGLAVVRDFRIIVEPEENSDGQSTVYQLQQVAGAAVGVAAWQPVSEAPRQ